MLIYCLCPFSTKKGAMQLYPDLWKQDLLSSMKPKVPPRYFEYIHRRGCGLGGGAGPRVRVPRPSSGLAGGPRNLSDPGIEPMSPASPALQAASQDGTLDVGFKKEARNLPGRGPGVACEWRE